MNGLVRQLGLAVAGVSLIAGPVLAQTETAPPAPPAAAQPATPAPTPPPSTSPPAAGETAPPATAQPGTPPAGQQPAPAAAQPAPASGTAVPEVEVIQEKKAEPPPPPPEQIAEPKPKKKVAAPPPKPVAQPAPQPVPEPDVEPADIAEPSPPASTANARASGNVVPISPAGGAEIEVKKYPGGVSTTSRQDLERNNNATVQDVVQKNVPGAILTDVAGSSFRSQLEYRGFGAGSVNGFPQGLAVYQNGVRINEVFGDVVNWDLIPSNAINDITILSGNPVYGLNAIGGGASILMKDGFNFQGVEIDVMGGSFGRRQGSAQVGLASDNFAVYWAGETIQEDGWRDFSEGDVQRMYFDIGARGSMVEAHFNLTWADSSAGVATASPEDILDVGWERTFTTPQVTDLNVVMPTLNLAVKATDTLTFSGLAYYRRYESRIIDGNLGEFEDCGAVSPGNLCADEDGVLEPLEDANGNPVPIAAIDEPYGVLDRINQDARSYGGTIQAVEKADLFGLKNQFLVGSSYDRGKVAYTTSSEIGTIGEKYVVTGSGIVLAEPDDFAPRDVDVQTRYFGIYFSDTISLTDQLALTVGGRYNLARIELEDLTGDFPGITSNHSFERFNPNVGATYEFLPGFTLYGGYSEANRAPTPAELACADPENPCPIESFLTDDPPLEQVVTKSWEVGLRGDNGGAGGQVFRWNLGYFHAMNNDDILFVSSATTGRGFFLNAGDTLRQGIEAGIEYEREKSFSVYANYSWVRATYETANEFSSPNNPEGEPCEADPAETCINVSPGDFIPGIPQHRFKAGFDVWLTSKWKAGADLIAASGQYFLGDDSNLLPKLPGYTRVDLHTSYDLTENFQIYGLVNNVFDQRYGLFGTLFDPEEATEAGEPSGYTVESPFGFVPAAPVAAYGGVKMKF